MATPTFLASALRRLRSDGALEPLPLQAVSFARPTILLAREHLQFELFEAPAELKAGAQRAAAKLFAQNNAPYASAGHVVTRRGRRFGLWWWDAALASDMLRAQGLVGGVRLLPEPLYYVPHDGWRVVRTESGYEAQGWDDGFLVADSWRRRPFDAQTWAEWTRVTGALAAVPAPTASPAPTPPAYSARSTYQRSLISTFALEESAPVAAIAVVGLLFAAIAYFGGEMLKLHLATEKLRAETQRFAASGPDRDLPLLEARATRLRAEGELARRPQPLMLLEAAQKRLEPYGYKLTIFSADASHLSLALPLEAVAGVDDVVSEMLDTGLFVNVRPHVERSKNQLVLDMDVVQPKGAPPPKASVHP